MGSKAQRISRIAANSADFPPVAICFQDQLITNLFAELLRAHGHTSRIIKDIGEVTAGTKVITEPLFLSSLPPASHPFCLLVADAEALEGYSGRSLVRPLTEEKVERALSQFFRSGATEPALESLPPDIDAS